MAGFGIPASSNGQWQGVGTPGGGTLPPAGWLPDWQAGSKDLGGKRPPAGPKSGVDFITNPEISVTIALRPLDFGTVDRFQYKQFMFARQEANPMQFI